MNITPRFATFNKLKPSALSLAPFSIFLWPSIMVAMKSPHLLDPVRLKYYVLWALLMWCLAHLIYRPVFLVLCCLFITLGVIEVMHLFMVGAPISQASMYVIFETNPMEALDFFGLAIPWLGIAASVFYIAVSIWLMRNGKSRRPTKADDHLAIAPRKKKPALPAVLIGIIFLVLAQYTAQGRFVEVLPPTLASGVRYYNEIQQYRQIAKQTKFRLARLKTQPIKDEQKRTHVLVIGESTNRNHLSLYGYPRKTNPLLETLQDELLIYTDVISPYSHTLPVLKTALTMLQQESKLEFYQAHSLIDFARAAGYEVSWLSNQLPIGAWDNMIGVMGSTANKSQFINYADSSKRAGYFASYDEQLLPSLEQTLNSPDANNKVIILHLMGTHAAYKKRYPSEGFSHFIQAEDKKQRLINEYDNAVLYNDHVIFSIINALKNVQSLQPGTQLTMTYFSDHGEEVYDSQDFAGHDWNRLSRHLVEIPFLVWVSDAFKYNNPSLYADMIDNQASAYMTDNFIHSFMDLAGIKSPHKKSEHSLFSPQLAQKQRFVYGKKYSDLANAVD